MHLPVRKLGAVRTVLLTKRDGFGVLNGCTVAVDYWLTLGGSEH
jgi:hypothetical protein